MSKMSEVMPKWGPYSKKYSGVSRVTEHETEKGVRFDFISLPAVSNTDAKAPNVTIPVGVHPWDVKVIILFILTDRTWSGRMLFIPTFLLQNSAMRVCLSGQRFSIIQSLCKIALSIIFLRCNFRF